MKGTESAGCPGLATSQHGTVNHTQSLFVSVRMTSTITPILTGRSYICVLTLSISFPIGNFHQDALL